MNIKELQVQLGKIDKSRLTPGQKTALVTIKQALRNIQQDCRETGKSTTSPKLLIDAENFASKYGQC